MRRFQRRFTAVSRRQDGELDGPSCRLPSFRKGRRDTENRFATGHFQLCLSLHRHSCFLARLNNGTIPKLAQAIYEEKAFDRLPVLADALEDAGCTGTKYSTIFAALAPTFGAAGAGPAAGEGVGHDGTGVDDMHGVSYMLKFVARQISTRKRDLFFCAVLRLIWKDLGDQGRRYVEVKERFADNEASEDNLKIADLATAGHCETWSSAFATVR